jgi:hypothetical protein
MVDDKYGAVDGIRIGKENRSTRIKPSPVPFYLPYIRDYRTYTQNGSSAVGNF